MNKKIPSFSILSSDTARTVVAEAEAKGLDAPLCGEILDSLSGAPLEVAVSLLSDSLLVRVYDNDAYFFLSPVGLTSPWDMRGAVAAVRDYAVKEMIPLRFTDVMRGELGIYTELFRFVDAQAYEDDDDLFFISVSSECDALKEIPSVSFGRVTLGELREDAKDRYSELCVSDEVNRFWGYNVKEDNPNPDAEYFLSVAEREFSLGVALTLGVYLAGELIGEGVLYGFDMSGGASVALRLLPEYWGMGLGSETLSGLIEIARNMGLLYLSTEVALENAASIAMTGKQMKMLHNEGERAYFFLEL